MQKLFNIKIKIVFSNAMIVYIILFSLLLVSCNNRKEKTESQTTQQQTSTTLDLYFIPKIEDLLSNRRPEIIDKISNKKLFLDDFEESTNVNIEKEIKKYLTRRIVYDKSSIFNDIP